MKFFILLVTFFVMQITFAQSSAPSFTDTVVKIKEDDEGKLIVLKNTKQVLYLKNTASNYEAVFSAIDNSLAFGSSVKISTDSNLNVIKAD